MSKEKLEKNEESSVNKKEDKKLAQLTEELEKAKADAADWKNQYYKVYADTQNLRKSLEEEKRDAIRYRASGFLDELIPALDAMFVALSAPAKNEEIKNYLQGFQYIYNQINTCLQNEGISEVLPKEGDGFDPNTMHAVDTVETEGEENKIAKVYAKGYKLHERLVRPAMVSVTKKKVEETKKDEKEETKAEDKTAQDNKA